MREVFGKALEVLRKKPIMLWGLSLLSVIITAIGFVVGGVILPVGIVVSYLISFGMAKIYLDGLEGKEVNSDQMFVGFNKSFLHIAGGMAWRDLWLVIWSCVPFIGPIIALVKGYAYAFVPYLMATNPEMKATEVLRVSKKMTEGMKGQMFLADIVVAVAVVLIPIVLALLSRIPVIGFLFTLALVVFVVLCVIFLPIFQGLYKAAFYAKKAVATAPAVEE